MNYVSFGSFRVYVVMRDNYERYDEMVKIFSRREDAEKYIKEKSDGNLYCHMEEVE